MFNNVAPVYNAKNKIYSELGYRPTIINARFIKPLDVEMLIDICKNHTNIITIEEGVLSGGFGSSISSFLHDYQLNNKLHRLGIPDDFVEHGTREKLLHDLGLHPDNIISILKNKIPKN